MPALVVDLGGGTLDPLTDLRCAADIRTGGLTTLQRITLECRAHGIGEVTGLTVPGELAPLVRTQHPELIVNEAAKAIGEAGEALVVNARCAVLPSETWGLGVGEGVTDEAGHLLAARLDSASALRLAVYAELPERCKVAPAETVTLLRRPWHVVRHRAAAIERDVMLLGADARVFEGGPGVHVLGEVRTLGEVRAKPGVVLDGSGGAIVLGDEVSIGANAVIEGPCVIGAHTVVSAGAVIRPGVATGPSCKIGGEVGSSIFQGYANKGHDGYLGDSYVGEWVNLGAGTDVSNLLNTYGEVKSGVPRGRVIEVGEADVRGGGTPPPPVEGGREMQGEREPTGMNFFGCVLGDHCKTAIGTRIMTGSVWGTAVMCAMSGLPPKVAAGFGWMTDRGVDAWKWEKCCETAAAMMKRRGIELGGVYEERLRRLAGGA